MKIIKIFALVHAIPISSKLCLGLLKNIDLTKQSYITYKTFRITNITKYAVESKIYRMLESDILYTHCRHGGVQRIGCTHFSFGHGLLICRRGYIYRITQSLVPYTIYVRVYSASKAGIVRCGWRAGN